MPRSDIIVRKKRWWMPVTVRWLDQRQISVTRSSLPLPRSNSHPAQSWQTRVINATYRGNKTHSWVVWLRGGPPFSFLWEVVTASSQFSHQEVFTAVELNCLRNSLNVTLTPLWHLTTQRMKLQTLEAVHFFMLEHLGTEKRSVVASKTSRFGLKGQCVTI